MYRYFLKSTNESSAKFGECQVCHKHASEVYIQSEQRSFVADEIDNQQAGVPVGTILWTFAGCKTSLGHKECLESIRREGNE